MGEAVGESARSYDSGKTWGSLITIHSVQTIYGIASSVDTAATNAFVAVGAAGNIATAGWNAVYSINNPTQENQLGSIILFSEANQTSRLAVNNVALPGVGVFGAAVQITGNFGVPIGAQYIWATLQLNDSTVVGLPTTIVMAISDNNTAGNAPNDATAHPKIKLNIAASAGVGIALSVEKDVLIHLNSSGQFYEYWVSAVNANAPTYVMSFG